MSKGEKKEKRKMDEETHLSKEQSAKDALKKRKTQEDADSVTGKKALKWPNKSEGPEVAGKTSLEAASDESSDDSTESDPVKHDEGSSQEGNPKESEEHEISQLEKEKLPAFPLFHEVYPKSDRQSEGVVSEKSNNKKDIVKTFSLTPDLGSIPRLTTLTLDSIREYEEAVMRFENSFQVTPSRDIDHRLRLRIEIQWLLKGIREEEWINPNVISTKEFCRELRKMVYPGGDVLAGGLNRISSLIDFIITNPPVFHPFNSEQISKEYVPFAEKYENFNPAVTEKEEEKLISQLLKSVTIAGNWWRCDEDRKIALTKLVGDLKVMEIKSCKQFFVCLIRKSQALLKNLNECMVFHPTLRDLTRSNDSLLPTREQRSNKKKGSQSVTDSSLEVCLHCKRNHGGVCRYADQPCVKCKICDWEHAGPCPKDRLMAVNAKKGKHPVKKQQYKNQKKGKSCSCDSCNSINEPSAIKNLIPMFLTSSQRKSKTLAVLLDTGASNDFISQSLLEDLKNLEVAVESSSRIVCSGLGECKRSVGLVKLKLDFTNEIYLPHTIEINAQAIDTDYDLIIGQKSIKQFNLAIHFPSQFVSDQWLGKMQALAQTQALKTPTLVTAQLERARRLSHKDITSPERLLVLQDKPVEVNKSKASNLRRDAYSREEVAEFKQNQLEAVPTELINSKTHTVEELHEMLDKTIFGPPSLQVRLRALLRKYSRIFSTTVSRTPARVPAFELLVDEKEWNIPRNRTPPRRIDKTRGKALMKEIQILFEAGLIDVSKAACYSHAFVVPKSNELWRVVIDFKNLNKITSAEKWPLPNIYLMIHRIGDHKPKFFAVMDLTSGYHQIPVSEDSRKWTAFMTPMGVYEWLRLPMGLKGAPSYFQRVMGSIVLSGLVQVICELYLDDIIVPGADEDEYLMRLETVFQRFDEYGLTLNPLKCKFGLSEVNYVGHLINEKGIHFTREKLDSILEIPKPLVQKQLKSFLGVANYFRLHVENYSTIAQPLHDMLKNYSKQRRLVWTEQAEKAFESIRKNIHECPMLFFMDDVSPIYLMTDASDYGIGAYLYQLVDNVEQPIGFISKSFNATEMNWHTAHKEGYAIFYALGKWEYLLRDRHFTLKTDHRNLTLLKDEFGHNQKVQRWLMCFQTYDFVLESVPGVDNVVADAFSRLCVRDVSPEVADRFCILEEIHVPKRYWETIKLVHNADVGHHGVERTIQKLESKQMSWKGVREHVRYFIKRCPCCQKMSQLKGPIHAHPFTLSTYGPMQRLAIDYIESLIPDEDGNTMIIVIIDTFSRFVEISPAKDNTARTSAKAILNHSGRYGVSQELMSDRGVSFINEIIEELTLMLGVEHISTTPYSKEENGIVERANKEVTRHLRNIIFDKHVLKSWSTYLPIVQRIMNASIHHSTGVSPAQILFGNAVDLDRGLFNSYIPKAKLSVWMADMLKAQASIMEAARKSLSDKDSIHIQQYDPERTEFPINSYVLVEHRQNALRKGPKSKLLPFLKGPMRVVNSNGNKYTLQNLVTNKNEDHHITGLRPFYFDPVSQNPLHYAIRDDGDIYIVDKISDIQGDLSGSKKQIQLQVHWVDVDKPTWEPWASVRATQALVDFLKNHTNEEVRRLLPTQYKNGSSM